MTMPMARPGTSKVFIPLWMYASSSGINALTRAAIGDAERSSACVPSGADTLSAAAVSSADPTRPAWRKTPGSAAGSAGAFLWLDAVIIDGNAPLLVWRI